MQDFLLYSAIPGPGRLCPVPACPADSHCVIVYPPAIQIATLDLLNFIKNESWVPCKMQNGGMGAEGFISSLGRDFADWVVIESLALPCLMASLLRRGSSAAQGDGEHGEPLRFFVGPDALIGPFLGGPASRSYGFTEALSETWRAGLGFAPSSAPVCALGHLPPQGEGLRAGEDTRPYGIYKSCPFFVGASPRPARGRGKPLPYESQEGFPNMGRGAPWGSRQNTYREHLLNQARRCCGTAPAAIFE